MRIRRHVLLLLGSVLLLGAGEWLLPYRDSWERLSVASAWLCMLLISAAMLIGPLRRIRGDYAPANIYARRDLGIWGALLGFVHFAAGNVVAMNAGYVAAFVHTPTEDLSVPIRDQLFSWGAITGTVVAILFLVLLLVSSDWSLRLLKPERWKKVQRVAHLALWLTIFHGIAYQLLEARYVPLALLLAVSGIVFWYQFRGRRRA